MLIEIFCCEFSVCQVSALPALPDGMVFLAITDKELSLVCETERITFDTLKREDGWRCMRVAGELDFSLIGILARLTDILAKSSISVFCTSTYDTDYIMVKADKLSEAADALKKAGYETKNI